jgi:beta-glucosidase
MSKTGKSQRASVSARMARGLFAVLCLSTSITAQADEVIFAANEMTPWQLFLGSSSNWAVPMQGLQTTTHKNDILTVEWIDNVGKRDAIQATWTSGLAQIYFQADYTRDYSEIAEKGGALSMVVRVDKAPRKSVDVKMDCGYPCAGTLNMTQLFKSVPTDQWFRVSLKLSCFEEAGANLNAIYAPLVVATKGSFKLSISDVRILENPPPESVIPCG